MKKLVAAVVALSLIGCISTTALAKETEVPPIGRTGGVIVEQGASKESFLPETTVDSSSLPSYYNSVNMGFVTPVKNQRTQNTCIFFSGIAAMETALLKSGEGEYDLSEEHANYWSSTRKDGTGWLRDRVNEGGYPYTSYSYLTTGGVVLESDLPYMSRTEQYFDDLEHIEPLFYAGGIKTLTGEETTAENYKRTILECGGVVSSFSYHYQYYNPETKAYCCNDSLSMSKIAQGAHSVFVVGWNDNYSKENFAASCKPTENGAWLIKNSWGEGDSDYIWVSYEDNYLAADIFGGNYAVKDVIKNHTCNELLSVDSYGQTYYMDFTGEDFYSNEMTFINTFSFSDNMRSISNVEFSTANNGADYIIYYIPTTNGTPAADESLWVELAKGTVEYSGIHNINFKPYTVPDNQGAVGVKIITNGDSAPSIGCSEWLTVTSTGEYIFLPKALDNRSFVVADGTTTNLSDYYTANNDDIGGNFTIKAVANVQLGDVNKDGKISVADTVLVQKHISNITILDSDTIKYVADANSDSTVTVADAVILQKTIANIISA